MKRLYPVVALGALLATSASAQTVSITFPIPPGTFDQAIGVSPDGEFVVGSGGTNGFLWSQAGGLVTGFGAPFEIWDVTDGATTLVGTAINGSGISEAAIWTPGGGLQFVGNALGAAGCGFDLSHLNGVSADGSTAVGMSWQGCQTSPMRWTDGVGLTLLAKQDANSSARCYRVSGDGQVAVGWDQGLPTGTAFTRRACVWTDDATQVFPATTPGNPEGYGEATNVNSDGSLVCGTTQNRMFRWSSTQGLQLLPGLGAGYPNLVANAMSEDASVVGGVAFTSGFPPSFDGVIWTQATGTVLMVDWLAAQGLTVNQGDVRNITGISADGKTIVGWGNSGPFVVTIDDGSPWTDLGAGLAGTGGTPALTAGGPLTAGSTTTLELDGALGGTTAYLVIGFSALDAPFKGGLLVPDADIVLPVPTSGTGEIDLAFAWPGGPSGVDTFWQYWIVDAGGPVGFSASNAVQGTTP